MRHCIHMENNISQEAQQELEIIRQARLLLGEIPESKHHPVERVVHHGGHVEFFVNSPVGEGQIQKAKMLLNAGSYDVGLGTSPRDPNKKVIKITFFIW